jgi:hypothetical protein
LPIGGFTGHVFLSPIGVKPPDPEPQTERPVEPELGMRSVCGSGSSKDRPACWR